MRPGRLCCSWWRAARACRRPWRARSPAQSSSEALACARVARSWTDAAVIGAEWVATLQRCTGSLASGSGANAPCPYSPSRTAVLSASCGSASLETDLLAQGQRVRAPVRLSCRPPQQQHASFHAVHSTSSSRVSAARAPCCQRCLPWAVQGCAWRQRRRGRDITRLLPLRSFPGAYS